MNKLIPPLLWFLCGGSATLLAGLVSGATHLGELVPRPGELFRAEMTTETPWPARLSLLTWHPDTPETPECLPCCLLDVDPQTEPEGTDQVPSTEEDLEP